MNSKVKMYQFFSDEKLLKDNFSAVQIKVICFLYLMTILRRVESQDFDGIGGMGSIVGMEGFGFGGPAFEGFSDEGPGFGGFRDDVQGFGDFDESFGNDQSSGDPLFGINGQNFEGIDIKNSIFST